MGQYDWIIGVTLCFMGSVISNMGVNFQKLCHMKLEVKAKQAAALAASSGTDAPTAPKIVLQPLWIGGLICIALGSVMDLLSFGFASLSLLAPLGAMTLVVNVLMAPLILKERLTKLDLVATAVIVAGTVLSVAFGSKESVEHDIHELMLLYIQPPFLIYICLLIGFVSWIYHTLKEIRLRMKANRSTPKDKVMEGVLYPALAGTFGALSVLFAKSVTEAVRLTAKGDNQLLQVQPYLMAGAMGGCVFLQLRYLNTSLTKADALLVVPIYQVFWVLLNVLSGMMYFQEYHDMPWRVLILFMIGAVITMIGIYILTHRKSTKDEEKDVELADMTENPLSESPVAPPRRESMFRGRSRSIEFSVGFASLMATPMPIVGEDAVSLSALSGLEGSPGSGGAGGGEGREAREAREGKPRLPSVSEADAAGRDGVSLPEPAGAGGPGGGVGSAVANLAPRRSVGIFQGLLNMLPGHGQGGDGSSSDLQSAMLGEEGLIDDSPLTVPSDPPTSSTAASASAAASTAGSSTAGVAVTAGSGDLHPTIAKGKSPRLGPSGVPTLTPSHGGSLLSPSSGTHSHYHELLTPVHGHQQHQQQQQPHPSGGVGAGGPGTGVPYIAPAVAASRPQAPSGSEEADFNPDFS